MGYILKLIFWMTLVSTDYVCLGICREWGTLEPRYTWDYIKEMRDKYLYWFMTSSWVITIFQFINIFGEIPHGLQLGSKLANMICQLEPTEYDLAESYRRLELQLPSDCLSIDVALVMTFNLIPYPPRGPCIYSDDHLCRRLMSRFRYLHSMGIVGTRIYARLR